jgi:uncharacterized protein (DUF362 family)
MLNLRATTNTPNITKNHNILTKDQKIMSIIYVTKTNDQKEFVTKIVKIYKQQLDQAHTIFIKPNIVSYEPYPTTTHPKTLDTLLTLLAEKT